MITLGTSKDWKEWVMEQYQGCTEWTEISHPNHSIIPTNNLNLIYYHDFNKYSYIFSWIKELGTLGFKHGFINRSKYEIENN